MFLNFHSLFAFFTNLTFQKLGPFGKVVFSRTGRWLTVCATFSSGYSSLRCFDTLNPYLSLSLSLLCFPPWCYQVFDKKGQLLYNKDEAEKGKFALTGDATDNFYSICVETKVPYGEL